MKRLIGLSVTLILGITLTTTGAEPMYQLDVTYTSGTIISGPLSFGLSTLPTSVTAMFILGPGHPSTEPGEEDDLYFDDEDLLAASVTFGNATWTESNLAGFDMMYNGNVNGLTYLFSPITTQVVDGGIVLNFPLSIIGTDIASNMPFEYVYTDSTQILTELPPIVIAAIDIKPGSYPNSINLGSHGLIPVAILSSDEFDATSTDPDTIELAGAGVDVRGKSNKYMAHKEDVNEDGLVDLVVQVATKNLDPDSFQDGYAFVTGSTYDGLTFEGADKITIVPPEE